MGKTKDVRNEIDELTEKIRKAHGGEKTEGAQKKKSKRPVMQFGLLSAILHNIISTSTVDQITNT